MKRSILYFIMQGVCLLVMGFCIFVKPDQVILWAIFANIIGLEREVLEIRDELR